MKFQLLIKIKMMKNKDFSFFKTLRCIYPAKNVKIPTIVGNIYEQDKFHAWSIWAWKKFYNLRSRSLIRGHLIGKENSIVVLIIAPPLISPTPYPVTVIFYGKNGVGEQILYQMALRYWNFDIIIIYPYFV